MTLATDGSLFTPPINSVAARLMSQRAGILSIWMERVKESIRAVHEEQEPILVDTMPALLENLAQALDPNYPRGLATEGTTIATEHGGERARLTRLSPGELVREYQLMRDILLENLSALAPLTEDEISIIIRSIDQAMSESLTAYFLVHEELREQFSLTLTHDIRNPLTAVKASAELILRYPDRVASVPVLAARIVENVGRIDRMTQDLLDASRIRFGEKIRFEVEQVELMSLLQDVIAQLKTVHGDRFMLSAEKVHGYWNADAFRRAVENLLVNAIKYGDPVAPVRVKMESMNGRVFVSVHNEGPHIPAEAQEGLFRSFMRTQSAVESRKRGWGLGLAMVRGMAEGHGGSITLDSTPERGTTFVIDIPIDSRPYLSKPMTPGTLINTDHS